MTQPVKQGRHLPGGPQRATRLLPWQLTQTEWRIVQAVCNGTLTRIQLAQHFGIEKRTVDTHLGHIFRKLGVPSTTGVVLRVLHDDAARRLCWPGLKIEDVSE